MKTVFLSIIFFLFTLISTAQDSTYSRKLCLKWAPFSLLDIYSGSSIRIGAEFQLNRRYGIYSELGTYIPNATDQMNNHGVLTKIELKYYLTPSISKLNSYISIELFYKHQSYGILDSIKGTPKNYLKQFWVTKDVGCFTLKYGSLKCYKHHFIVDKFIGIGLRQKNASSSLSNIENDNIKPSGDYSLNIFANRAGVLTFINIDIGIKIGYCLR